MKKLIALIVLSLLNLISYPQGLSNNYSINISALHLRNIDSEEMIYLASDLNSRLMSDIRYQKILGNTLDGVKLYGFFDYDYCDNRFEKYMIIYSFIGLKGYILGNYILNSDLIFLQFGTENFKISKKIGKNKYIVEPRDIMSISFITLNRKLTNIFAMLNNIDTTILEKVCFINVNVKDVFNRLDEDGILINTESMLIIYEDSIKNIIKREGYNYGFITMDYDYMLVKSNGLTHTGLYENEKYYANFEGYFSTLNLTLMKLDEEKLKNKKIGHKYNQKVASLLKSKYFEKHKVVYFNAGRIRP
jgi:hypothetical protein